MSSNRKPWVLRALLAPLLALLLLFAGGVFGAPPTAEQVAAMQELERYLGGPTSQLDLELTRMGFDPPVPRSEWAKWSSERKIMAAYIAAEQAAEGSGKRVLSRVTEGLEQTYGDSVYSNRHLASLHPERVDQGPIRFETPSLADIDSATPSRQLKGQIAEMSRYLSGGAFGSTTDVLHNHFGYSVHDAVDMSIRHGGDMQTMLEAVHRDKPQDFDKGVSFLNQRISEVYGRGPFDGPGGGPSPNMGLDRGPNGPRNGPQSPRPPPSAPVSEHADFVSNSAAASTSSATDYGGGGGGGVGGGGGGGGDRVSRNHSRNTGRYVSFQRNAYLSGKPGAGPRRSALKFSRMSRGARGFGGVVFGNETRLAGELGRLERMEFRVESDGSLGTYVLGFANGDTLSFGPVPVTHAYVARRMVSGELPGLQPLAIDDGVGLIGIADNTPFVKRCKAKSRKLEIGESAFHVVTHPALENTSLGWAALYVDVWAISIDGSLQTIDVSATEADEDFIRRLFGGTGHGLSAGTWKVVDAPLEFVAEGSRLLPRRIDDEMPEPVRASSFLDMHVITKIGDIGADGSLSLVGSADEGIDHGFKQQFAEALPRLTRVSWAYDELNRFAPVLALNRIARHDGVELPTIAAPTPGESTPLAITVGDEGLQTLPPFDRKKLAEPSIDKLERCLNEIAMRSKAAREFLDDDERIKRVLVGDADEDDLDNANVVFAASVLRLGLRLSQEEQIKDAPELALDVAFEDDEPASSDAPRGSRVPSRGRPVDQGCGCVSDSSGGLGGLLVLGLAGLLLGGGRRVRRA